MASSLHPQNVGFEEPFVQELCDSKGDQTVHICTKDVKGVYVNGVNLMAELERLKNITDSINEACLIGSTSGRRLMGDPCYKVL